MSVRVSNRITFSTKRVIFTSNNGNKSVSLSDSSFHLLIKGGMSKYMNCGRFSWDPTASANVPKASYKIKFNKKDMLFGYRKIKFRSLTTDPSYIREKLAFDLAESFGLPTTRYSYAR